MSEERRRSFTEAASDMMHNVMDKARDAAHYATGAIFNESDTSNSSFRPSDSQGGWNNAAPNSEPGPQGDSEKYGSRVEPAQENIGARQQGLAH